MHTPNRLKIAALSFFLFVSLYAAHSAQAEEATVDFIVATVEGTPITLSEVSKRAGIPIPKSLSDASRNTLVQSTLEEIIVEYLLKAAAKQERITTSKEEIERYIDRVAEQNNLNRIDFESALKAEGKSMASYKKKIEIEILRSKIAGTMLRDGISVSEEEIDRYLEDYPEEPSAGSQVKLRQIFLSLDSAEASAKLNEIRQNIDDVDDFAKEAAKISEGPEAEDGGLLGVVTEEDLSEQIFDALYKLPTGQVSEVVETPIGYHLFFIEERLSKGDEDDDEYKEKKRDEIRKELEEKKLEDRMQTFFSQELLDKFAVEKKI